MTGFSADAVKDEEDEDEDESKAALEDICKPLA
jgi:hypothetical protein